MHLLEYNNPMKIYKKKPWTTTERKLLALHYFNIPLEELMELIPGRTETAIRNQVSYLRKRSYRFIKRK